MNDMPGFPFGENAIGRPRAISDMGAVPGALARQGSDMHGVVDLTANAGFDPYWQYVRAYLPLTGRPGRYATAGTAIPTAPPAHNGDNLWDAKGGNWAATAGSDLIIVPGPIPIGSALLFPNPPTNCGVRPNTDTQSVYSIAGSDPFSIELHFCYIGPYVSGCNFFGAANTWNGGAWVLQMGRNGANGALSFLTNTTGVNRMDFFTLALATTYHICLERYLNTYYCFVNGVSAMTPANTGSNEVLSHTGEAFFGDLPGYIWNFRMTVGAARYAQQYGAGVAFTPPDGSKLYPMRGP